MSEDGEADLVQDGKQINFQKKDHKENSEMKGLKEMRMRKEILFPKYLQQNRTNQSSWRQLKEKSKK